MRSVSKRKQRRGEGDISQSIRASEGGSLTEESKSILGRKLSTSSIPQGGSKESRLQMHGLNSPRRVRPSFQVRPASCSPMWQSQDQKPCFRAGCGSKDLLPHSQKTEAGGLNTPGAPQPRTPNPTPCPSRADNRYLSATLASVMARGGTFQGQLMRPPGRRLKSNWQQILGSGPQVCGTS